MTTHAAPSLPVEIIVHIIDELATDVDSLLNCSMVSTTWRSRALHHLFRQVSIYTESTLESLAALLNANPSLVTHIRRVDIFSTNIELSHLPTLWNVSTLHLTCVRFPCDATLNSSIGQITATLPRVECLFLLDSLLCSTHDMPMRLFMSLPHLRRLHLTSNVHRLCEMPAEPRSQWICTLDTLHLTRPTPSILNSLADAWQSGFSTVENLEFTSLFRWRIRRFDHGEYRDGLSAFTHSTTALRNVQLETDTMDEMAFVLQTTEILAHKYLRTISLRCVEPAEYEHPQSLLSLIQVIRGSSIRPDNLRLSVELLYTTDSAWQLVLDSLVTLSSPDTSTPELILDLDEKVFPIVSLAALERVLGSQS